MGNCSRGCALVVLTWALLSLVPDGWERPVAAQAKPAVELEWVGLSDDKRHFATSTGRPFHVWGVNYDHDGDGRLLEDYWRDNWSTVADDFHEITLLGANVVRIHLQLAQFMETPQRPRESSLEQLGKLVRLAERSGLYLDITGLGCYHRRDVPAWYDSLPEAGRWEVQCRFWRAVAQVCRDSPAVFCYDLMNEPILPGQEPATEWLAGELGGKHFVQRITLDLSGRERNEVARQWVAKLTDAIREVDQRHLVTVGVIPWALTFPNAKPLFYAPEVGAPLDFVSVHFYPRAGEVPGAIKALETYSIGKPLVIEEIFPLKAGLEETAEFIDKSRAHADGWVSFYWGRTIEENEQAGTLAGAITAKWLRWFQQMAPQMAGATRP